jgi:hypothetical protein
MGEKLSPIIRTEQPEWKITGEYFADYLTGVIYPLPENAFTKKIDLSLFTPVFNYLYDTHQDVFELSDEDRERFHSQLDQQPEPLNETIAEMRKKEQEMIDRKLPGERYTALYMDVETMEIGNSDIVFGKKDMVEFDTRSLIDEGKLPFASVHTHPQEYLPSPQDVSHVLTDFDGKGLRQIKCGIVLLPNSQVLFVATDSTLRLSEAQTEQFVEKWSGLIHHDPKIIRYSQYLVIIQRKLVAERLPEMVDAVMKDLVGIEEKKNNGVITEDEMNSIADDIISEYKKEAENVEIRLGLDSYKAKKTIERRINQIHQAMLKEAGVKVYVSYDRKDFDEVDF